MNKLQAEVIQFSLFSHQFLACMYHSTRTKKKKKQRKIYLQTYLANAHVQVNLKKDIDEEKGESESVVYLYKDQRRMGRNQVKRDQSNSSSVSLTSGEASILRIRRFFIIGWSSSSFSEDAALSSPSGLATRFRFKVVESDSSVVRACPRNVRPPLTCPRRRNQPC